MFVVFMG